MEISSAKVLDEVCNDCNDAYSDEILYAAWALPTGVDADAHTTHHEQAKSDVKAFLARFAACRG